MSFVDAVQGAFAQNLAIECGDFIVRRADGLIAYHLAVAVDDAFSGVTEVLRGADLLDSTPRQIWLQRLLGLPTPSYAHIPLVIGANGKKLSKQFGAPGISAYEARSALYHALIFLGLSPPPDLAGAAPAELLAWAIPRWRLELPGVAPRSYSWPLAEVNIARNSS